MRGKEGRDVGVFVAGGPLVALATVGLVVTATVLGIGEIDEGRLLDAQLAVAAEELRKARPLPHEDALHLAGDVVELAGDLTTATGNPHPQVFGALHRQAHLEASRGQAFGAGGDLRQLLRPLGREAGSGLGNRHNGGGGGYGPGHDRTGSCESRGQFS